MHCISETFKIQFKLLQIDSYNCSVQIQKMFNPFERVYSTDQNLYFKTDRYEIWAHLQPDSVLIQLRSFFIQGGVKTFAKSLTKLSNQNILINHKAIFQELSRNLPKNCDSKKGKIILEIKNSKSSKNNETVQIELEELKNEPTLDNWLMLKIIKEKSEQLQEKIHDNNYVLSDSIDLESQSNLIFRHETQRYRFEAELDSANRAIKTQLVVKGSTRQGKGKDKCYKSAIKQKDWGHEYRSQFKNIQTLFQHLKNTNNYEVLESKGLIKIKNEPIPILDLTNVKNVSGIQTEKRLTKNATFSEVKKRTRKDSESLQAHKKILIQKQIMMAKQINQLGQKLQNKLYGFIKDSEKQISNYENEEYKKYQGKFKSLEKQIRNQLNSNLKKQLEDIRNEAQRTIKQIVASYEIKMMSESSANMRKSHLIQPRNKSSQTRAERIKKIPTFQDKQRVEIDESSSQIQYFYVGQDGDVTYRGSWDWTQVFTTSKIDFQGVYQFRFRVLKSIYNAIAIGVSSSTNKQERSSLTKAESISYWGDGQIWEKNKIKEQGDGFRVGSTVSMQVNRKKGQIKWMTGDSSVSHISKILNDPSITLFAYLEMYDNGDKIELLTCKII